METTEHGASSNVLQATPNSPHMLSVTDSTRGVHQESAILTSSSIDVTGFPIPSNTAAVATTTTATNRTYKKMQPASQTIETESIFGQTTPSLKAQHSLPIGEVRTTSPGMNALHDM